MDASRTFDSNYSIDASSSGLVSTISATPVTASGLSVTITTTGRPVMVGLAADNDNPEAYIEFQKAYSSWAGGYIYILRDGVIIAQYKFNNYIASMISAQGTGSISSQGYNTNLGPSYPNTGIAAGANSGITVSGIDAILSMSVSCISTLDLAPASTRTYTIQFSSLNGSTVRINSAIMYAYEI